MTKKKTTIDDLAVMVKNGFDDIGNRMADRNSVDQRFDSVDQRFDSVDQRFDSVDQRFGVVSKKLEHIDARLAYIERDVAEIRKHFVYRDEFEDALARLRLVEKKLGIKS